MPRRRACRSSASATASNRDLLPDLELARPRRRGVLDAQALVATDELLVRVADEPARLVLPGGFSYGDYLRAGAIAALAPIMTEVKDAAAKGMPILVRPVPEGYRLSAGQADRASRVAVVERSGEGDDPTATTCVPARLRPSRRS
jgi:hypothetical protein